MDFFNHMKWVLSCVKMIENLPCLVSFFIRKKQILRRFQNYLKLDGQYPLLCDYKNLSLI